LAGACGGDLRKKQWLVPESYWTPLRKAACAFRSGKNGELNRISGLPQRLMQMIFEPEFFESLPEEEKQSYAQSLEYRRNEWHKHYLPAFNHAVATRKVALYAQSAVSAPFERLPAELWPLLNVVDWIHGVARAADGTEFLSIHVEFSTTGIESPPRQAGQKPKRGRKPKVDWDGFVKPRLFKLLDYHGCPNSADPEWRHQADVEKAVADICGVSVAESTVREHTRRLLSEWRHKKAGN
jgi:hypothetical protein